MINTKELRLGNMVLFMGSMHSVTLISEKELHFAGTSWIMSDEINSQPEPIPLTPERLKMCGFVDKGDFYTLNDLISFGVNSNGALTATYILGDNDAVDIKYLHQLQNLYFTLMNEELSISS